MMPMTETQQEHRELCTWQCPLCLLRALLSHTHLLGFSTIAPCTAGAALRVCASQHVQKQPLQLQASRLAGGAGTHSVEPGVT